MPILIVDFKDTHCVSFDFKITGHGELSVYVIRDFFVYSQPVWSSQSITTDWTTVQLALSPQSYKVSTLPNPSWECNPELFDMSYYKPLLSPASASDQKIEKARGWPRANVPRY